MTPEYCAGLKPSGCLPWPADWLLSLLVGLIWPSQAALSGLVSLCLPTSIEKEDSLKLVLRRVTLGPLYTAIFLLFLPAALCAIPLRCLLCLMKKPFQYSVLKKAHTDAEERFLLKSLSGGHVREHQFGIASANLCLLPEFLARINNISHSAWRARTLGERIVVDQFFYGGVPRSILGLPANGMGKNDVKKSKAARERFVGGLATHFPRLDFLCLQEMFDWHYSQLLRQELHKVSECVPPPHPLAISLSLCLCLYYLSLCLYLSVSLSVKFNTSLIPCGKFRSPYLGKTITTV